MLSTHTQYVVNEKSEKSSVLLPFSEWEKILLVLEEYDDILAYDKAKVKKSDPLDWETVKKSLASK
jgi:hypothetical protein